MSFLNIMGFVWLAGSILIQVTGGGKSEHQPAAWGALVIANVYFAANIAVNMMKAGVTP